MAIRENEAITLRLDVLPLDSCSVPSRWHQSLMFGLAVDTQFSHRDKATPTEISFKPLQPPWDRY